MSTYSLPQLNQNKAMEFGQAQFARLWTDNQIAWFQLNQNLLCVEFNIFRQALSSVLQHPVFVHDLSTEGSKLILCKVTSIIPDNDKKFVEDFLNMFLGLEEIKITKV